MRAKVTRLAPYSAQMPDMTMITVEMPNGNREMIIGGIVVWAPILAPIAWWLVAILSG